MDFYLDCKPQFDLVIDYFDKHYTLGRISHEAPQEGLLGDWVLELLAYKVTVVDGASH
jgi:hypothetical protein